MLKVVGPPPANHSMQCPEETYLCYCSPELWADLWVSWAWDMLYCEAQWCLLGAGSEVYTGGSSEPPLPSQVQG